MSDVAMYDDELKALEDQVSDLIRAMDRVSPDQRLDKYNKAQDLLKRLNKTFHQFKVEVRMLDGGEQAVYEKKCQSHDSTITSLKTQLQQKRAEANQASSPASTSASGSPAYGSTDGGRRGDGKDEARDATKRIAKTQDGTIAALRNAERTVNETEEIGNDAAGTLRKQTEQIKEMNENLDQLDSEVNRAKKELNAFIRRMMTDKIILCFAFLVVVGIIVIVVMKIRKDKTKKKDHTATPAPEKSDEHLMSVLAYAAENIPVPPALSRRR